MLVYLNQNKRYRDQKKKAKNRILLLANNITNYKENPNNLQRDIRINENLASYYL